MSRWIFAALACVMVSFGAVSTAEAKGGGRFGTEDKFYNIEPLQISPDQVEQEVFPPEWGQGAYLASHKKVNWLFLGVGIQDEGYAVRLASGGDEYWPLDKEQLALMRDLGVITEAEPIIELAPIEYAIAYSLWIALGVVALWGALTIGWTRMRSRAVAAEVQADFGALLRMVLIQAAAADGDIDDKEVETIATVMAAVLGTEQDKDAIRQEAANIKVKSGQLSAYLRVRRKHLDEEQKRLILGALVKVCQADSVWSKGEQKSLTEYVAALLDAKRADADKIVKELARA